MRLNLILAIAMLSNAHSGLRAQSCEHDSIKTKIGALMAKPGAILTSRYEPLGALTKGSSNVRIERWTVQEDAGMKAMGLAVLVHDGSRFHKSLLDPEEVSQLAKAVGSFEQARSRGGLANDIRQEFATVDGLRIVTFWDGQQRVVGVESKGACRSEVFLDADALARLRDILAVWK